MRTDPLDEMMTRLFPPVTIAPERVDRLIAGVMAELNSPSLPAPRWGAAWMLPMAATVAGLIVGHHLPSAGGDMNALTLILTSPMLPGSF